MSRKIKIGILGTRGIPNKYGGFEQFAQYLSESLVKNDFDVTVYNPHFHTQTKNISKEIKIIYKWCPEKYFGAASHIIYDFLCLKDALKKDLDILLELGYASSSLGLFFVKKGSSKIIFNMDGMEWKRKKWSYAIKVFTKWHYHSLKNWYLYSATVALGIATYSPNLVCIIACNQTFYCIGLATQSWRQIPMSSITTLQICHCCARLILIT